MHVSRLIRAGLADLASDDPPEMGGSETA
jgi:hypothetical protein